jgi:hypothetical protein
MQKYSIHSISCIDGDEIVPGAMVCHYIDPLSRGMVVWVVDNDCGVVWSKEPVNPLDGIFTKIKPVGMSTIAQQLCSVQPMSLPSGLIFYIDYQYGKKVADGKNDKRSKCAHWGRRSYMRDRTRDAREFPCRRRKSRLSNLSMRK